MTSEVGWLGAARLYPAGPFTFFRPIGEPLREREERSVLRELRAAQSQFAASTGSIDPAAYLRAEPLAFLRLIWARRPKR